MRIAFLALSTKSQRGVEAHAATASADGHRVVVYVHGVTRWERAVFPAGTEVVHIASGFEPAREGRLTRLLVRRVPLGVLRRLGRGPLRPPCERLSGAWRYHVVRRIDRRRKRRNAHRRRDAIDRALLREFASRTPDRLVLVDGGSVAVAARILPRTPPAMREVAIMYGYEDFKEPLDV